MTITTTDLDRVARQRERIRTSVGFIAALDQSGGSTPRAHATHGVDESAWTSEGYDLHESCRRLREAGGMTASISQMLMTGLTADLDDETFELRVADTVARIHEASIA